MNYQATANDSRQSQYLGQSIESSRVNEQGQSGMSTGRYQYRQEEQYPSYSRQEHGLQQGSNFAPFTKVRSKPYDCKRDSKQTFV